MQPELIAAASSADRAVWFLFGVMSSPHCQSLSSCSLRIKLVVSVTKHPQQQLEISAHCTNINNSVTKSGIIMPVMIMMFKSKLPVPAGSAISMPQVTVGDIWRKPVSIDGRLKCVFWSFAVFDLKTL